MSGPRLEKLGVANIWGQYEDGILTGRGKVFMRDGSALEGWFQHGYFHGPARSGTGRCYLGLHTTSSFRGCSDVGEMNFIGHYKAGLPTGVVWKKCEGGGK